MDEESLLEAGDGEEVGQYEQVRNEVTRCLLTAESSSSVPSTLSGSYLGKATRRNAFVCLKTCGPDK